MAKITSGILGPFTGRLGTAVGYMWRQKACVRAYQPHIHFPNTPLQQQQHSWFISMVRFAAVANPALKLGYKLLSYKASMTDGNYFVTKNKEHFHIEDGQIRIDYDKLQLSAGSTADVYFKSPRFEQNETISVEFEKNSLSLRALNEDSVYLFVYSPSLGEGFLSAPVARRAKHLRIRLPEEWSGNEVHLYGFVIDRDGRASNSTYIGVGRVNHYEDRGRYIPLDNKWQEFVNLANGSIVANVNVSEHNEAIEKTIADASDTNGDPPGIP